MSDAISCKALQPAAAPTAAVACAPAFVVMKFLLLVSPMMGFSVRAGTGAFSFSLGLLGELAAGHNATPQFAGQQAQETKRLGKVVLGTWLPESVR